MNSKVLIHPKNPTEVLIYIPDLQSYLSYNKNGIIIINSKNYWWYQYITLHNN